MINQDKVSIVIPLYNKENFIERAVNSVLTQTVQDFELIIVDDGSTDRSFEMANAIQDPRIRIIRQENRGVSAARNRGILEANCDWVAFLDADDEWLPGFLEEISYLRKIYPQCGVAGTGYYIVDTANHITVNQIGLPEKPGWKGIFENYLYAIKNGYPFNSSSYAAKKGVLITAGLYPEDTGLTEDTSLYINLSRSQIISYSYTPLSIYHQEVKNRTWKGFNADELHVTKIGKEMLLSADLEPTHKESLYEYLVRAELGRVRALLYQGKNAEAREVLLFCSKSIMNANAVKKLSKWANAPRYSYRAMHLLKDRIKLLLKKFEDLE